MLDKQILLLITLSYTQVFTLSEKGGVSKNIPKWKKQACEAPQRNSHYKCDENGDLKCLAGWSGDLCTVPLCKRNCDPQNGFCKRPFECRCKLGFYGEYCNHCIPLPGCQNGSCRNPFECHCFKGWRGAFCSEPICKDDCHPSHGYCETAGECKCRIGWTGKTCRDCQLLPGCVHGTCGNPFECQCLPGWTGFLCDRAICTKNCSRNNGYCTKPNTCRCKVGWMGRNCTECHPYPGCLNGYCNRPWECVCKAGWGGFLCDEELNYCEKNPNVCENGGTCKSLSSEDGNFECYCLPGFFGPQCERMNNTLTTTNRIESMITFTLIETTSQEPILSVRNNSVAFNESTTTTIEQQKEISNKTNEIN